MGELDDKCLAFVTEQSAGEWDDKTIREDAASLAEFVRAERADLVAALEAMMRQHGGLGCSAAYKQAEVTLAKVKS